MSFIQPSGAGRTGTSDIIELALVSAWSDCLLQLNDIYPTADYSLEELYRMLSGFMETAAERYSFGASFEAGEMRAEARAVAALMAERGIARYLPAKEAILSDMRRVIAGVGPEPLMVSSTNGNGDPELRVADDEFRNLARLAEWCHAARFALRHYLPPLSREMAALPPLPCFEETSWP